MFHKLQHKLTLVYAALFGLVFIVLSGATYWGVTTRAAETVRGEMNATVAVFQQIWSLQEAQLAESAGLLSRDFGFRSAVATGDTPTVQSALDNLKGRLDVDAAFVVSVRGGISGLDPGMAGPVRDQLVASLTEQPSSSGVAYFDGAAYQAVAAPVLAPDLIGWVVFARELSSAELARFADLAPIALTARLYYTESGTVWLEPANPDRLAAPHGFLEVLSLSPQSAPEAHIRATDEGRMISSAISISPFLPGSDAVLVLDFPLQAALAPYQSILVLMLAIAAAGFGVLITATWLVARSLTRPITDLDAAASRLAAGEHVRVSSLGRDEIGRLGASFNDMVEQILTRERDIRHAARHDQESGLPNRSALLETLATADAPGDQVYLATVGVDRFHEIRNAIGYDLSAQLLREVARNLGAVEAVSVVARVATSALAVVFTASSRAAALAAADNLASAASQPVPLNDGLIDINVTIGLAEASAASGPDALGPLELSGVALEQARASLQPSAFFDPARYGDPVAKLSLMSSMISALGTQDIYLAYQPKLDLHTGSASGAEALLRWRHPERGFIPPDMFVDLAEETGHIIPLTDWVVGQAIRDQARLREAGHDVRISVNISGRLICDMAFMRQVLERIRQAGADLVLEITETAVINNPEKALAVMNEVTGAGVTLSIDDYGAGLSNLTYLKLIPAAELKIDKAFVLSLASNKADALLVKSTIDLAHSLGMKVTAEGVENDEALSMLAAMGAEFAQGYHISRPEPLAVMMSWLDAHKASPAAARSKSA